jgi:hypothetical protein
MLRRVTTGIGQAVRLCQRGIDPSMSGHGRRAEDRWECHMRTAKTRKTRADQGEMEIEVWELFIYENQGNILNKGVTMHACS